MKPPVDPTLERISLRSIGGYILESLNLERGLGYTIHKLIVYPYAAIREFLFEDRRRMVKPLTLLLLLVGIATFLSFRFLGLEDELTKSPEPIELLPGFLTFSPEQVVKITVFLRQYFNLALISALPFLALASWLIFRGQGLNYAEHLVINVYIYCIQTIMVIVWIPLFPATGYSSLTAILLTFVVVAYMIYAYKKIFEQSWLHGVLKTLAVYLIGQFLYSFFSMLVFGILLFFI